MADGNQISSWWGEALILGVSIGILGSLFWSLHRAKIPLTENAEGWIETCRSIFDHVIGTIQLLLGSTFLFFGIASPFFLDSSASFATYLVFLAMLSMGFFFVRSFFYSYLAKIRFNSSSIEYRAPFREISVAWNEVREIKIGYDGPTVHTVEGKFSISNTRRGFHQLVQTARTHNTNIQLSPLLRL